MSTNQGPQDPRQEPPWSEDRQWWWNGQEWRSAAEYRPTTPPGIMRKTGKAFIVMGLGVLSASIGQTVLIAAVFSNAPHIPPGVRSPAAWVIGYLAGAFILPAVFGGIGNLLVWWGWRLFQHGRYPGRYDRQWTG